MLPGSFFGCEKFIFQGKIEPTVDDSQSFFDENPVEEAAVREISVDEEAAMAVTAGVIELEPQLVPQGLPAGEVRGQMVDPAQAGLLDPTTHQVVVAAGVLPFRSINAEEPDLAEAGDLKGVAIVDPSNGMQFSGG